MTALMDGHVRIDEKGVFYVGDSRLKLIHLVMSYQEGGDSAEWAHEAYDWLPPADLYGALAYYFDHREEVDGAIQAYQERSEAWRSAAGESPLAKRLRENREA